MNKQRRNNIICLFLTFMLSNTFLFSQTRHTVILTKEDYTKQTDRQEDKNILKIAANDSKKIVSQSVLKFDFKNLPKSFTPNSISLKLYNFNNNLDETGKQIVNVYDTNNTSKSIGSTRLTKNKKDFLSTLNIKGALNNNLSLSLQSTSRISESNFYSSVLAKQKNVFSYLPKLLIEYEINVTPFRSDWAQPFANAQHISFLNWKTNAVTKEVQIKNIKPKNVALAEPVVVYKNQPIIFTNTSGNENKYKVNLLSNNGKTVWETEVDNTPKCSPLIDENGLLYYFSTSNTLTILDLKNLGEKRYRKSISEITNNKITRINTNVTMGYDGTLYLPSDGGIVALSAYPELKIRWLYKQEEQHKNGPISLSLNERNAFFIDVSVSSGKSRLIMLDNNDGTILDSTDYVFGNYKNDNNYYIPAPIIHTKEKKTKVFVLNGYDTSNQIFIFDIDKKKIKDQPFIIASENTTNTGISQPVIDKRNNVFFVFKGKIAFFNTDKNSTTVFENSNPLNSASILVTDASSNIYAIDPYDNNNEKIIGFNYTDSFKNLFSTKLKAQDSNIGIRKNIVLAPDGTLYTTSLNNLIAINAKRFNNDILELNTINTKNTYKATKSITLKKQIINSSVNAIFYTAGQIYFKPGITIKKGSELTFKTIN